jgi:anti-sigma B factor antagonist
MDAKAAIRFSGNVAIVDLTGRITMGDGCGLIRNTIKGLLSAGHKNILLNLQEVKHIDSSGLGEMASAYATVSNMGGKIKFLNVHSKVSDLLQVTKLYTVFVTFADEAEAVRSFGTAAGA